MLVFNVFSYILSVFVIIIVRIAIVFVTIYREELLISLQVM